jgi:hypothetical protein
MRHFMTLVAAGALVAGPVPVAAATPTTDVQSARDAEQKLAEFSDCVVAKKSRRSLVNLFLRKLPNSESYFDASMKAADLHCLDSAARRENNRIQLKIQPATFRDALYPALYRRDFGGPAPASGIAALPAQSLRPEFDGPIEQLPPQYLASRRFGDCVARQDPDDAHVLLLAKPYTTREDAALAQLKQALPSCIADGQTLHLTRGAIRAAVGEAMYKLSQAAHPTT